jgi:hypothetical protein
MCYCFINLLLLIEISIEKKNQLDRYKLSFEIHQNKNLF